MVASSHIKKLRVAAYNNQKGKCYYCDCQMFETELSDLKEFAFKYFQNSRISDNIRNGHIYKRTNMPFPIRNFRCTLEHLHKSFDGGLFSNSNTVASCAKCNTDRGGLCHWQHKVNKGKRVDFKKDYQNFFTC